MKPQARKVLRHLKAAGAAGVHSRQLRQDFIADPPTRVCELRALGFNITREKEGNGTRYRLVPTEVGVDTGSQSAHANGVDVDPGGSEGRSPGRIASPPRSDGGGQVHTAAPIRYPVTAPHQLNTVPDWRDGWRLVFDYLDRARPRCYWELEA